MDTNPRKILENYYMQLGRMKDEALLIKLFEKICEASSFEERSAILERYQLFPNVSARRLLASNVEMGKYIKDRQAYFDFWGIEYPPAPEAIRKYLDSSEVVYDDHKELDI